MSIITAEVSLAVDRMPEVEPLNLGPSEICVAKRLNISCGMYFAESKTTWQQRANNTKFRILAKDDDCWRQVK
jgi:hypothetical protein